MPDDLRPGEVEDIEGIEKLGELSDAERVLLKMFFANKIRAGLEYRLQSFAIAAKVRLNQQDLLDDDLRQAFDQATRLKIEDALAVSSDALWETARELGISKERFNKLKAFIIKNETKH